MANGVLDYKRYLQTLQTITDIGGTFPSSQRTYLATIDGNAHNSAFTATIEWNTVLIDQVDYNRYTKQPIFDNSTIIGYFPGGSTSQYTTATISLPAFMYNGPVLPGGVEYVPLTVVNVTWTGGTMPAGGVQTPTFQHQLAFLQNWEPGIEIRNPWDDFNVEVIDPVASTLTLTGPTRVIFGDTVTYTATSDIPLDMGTTNTVKFYKIVNGTTSLLGTANFIGSQATLTISTDPNLPIEDYTIYAITRGWKEYGRQTSNSISLEVVEGIPLLVNTSTFTPSKSYYYPGDVVTHFLGVIPDPSFGPSPTAIANTLTVKLIDGFSPYAETTVENDAFNNGQNTAVFTVQSSMIDTALAHAETQYTVQSSTQSGGVYTATVFVYNTETVKTSWGFQTVGRYAHGSTSPFIYVGTSTSRTVIADAFPITISNDLSETLYDETFNITVTTPTGAYYRDLTIYANSGTTTRVLATGSNHGSTTWTISTSSFLNTGTWTLYATYPGDLGVSLINANSSATSNTISHQIVQGNLRGPMVLTAWRTDTHDYLNLYASATKDLIREVTFKNNTTVLGTSTFVRRVVGANTQTATLELPLNTISFNTTTIHATWPGTLDLPTIYGKFDPVDVYLSSPFTVNLSVENISSDVGLTSYSTTTVYDTNPVKIIARILANYYQYPVALNTGTVSFNYGTPKTVNVVNNIASVDISGSDFNISYPARAAQDAAIVTSQSTNTVTINATFTDTSLVNTLTSVKSTSVNYIQYNPRISIAFGYPYNYKWSSSSNVYTFGNNSPYRGFAANMASKSIQIGSFPNYYSLTTPVCLGFPTPGKNNDFPANMLVPSNQLQPGNTRTVPFDNGPGTGFGFLSNDWSYGSPFSTSSINPPQMTTGTVVLKGQLKILMPFPVVGTTEYSNGIRVIGTSSTVDISFKYNIGLVGGFGTGAIDTSLFLPFPDETKMNAGESAESMAYKYYELSHNSATPNVITIDFDTTNVRNIDGNGEYGLPTPDKWYTGYVVTATDTILSVGFGEVSVVIPGTPNSAYFYYRKYDKTYPTLKYDDPHFDQLWLWPSINNYGFTTNGESPMGATFVDDLSQIPALPSNSKIYFTSKLYTDRR